MDEWKALGHLNDVLSLAFSSDSNLLASGGREGMVKIWDAPGRKLVRTLRLKHEPSRVHSVAFLPGDQIVAIGCFLKVFLWNIAEEAAGPFPAEACEELVVAGDGRGLAIRARGQVDLWDLANFRMIRTVPLKVRHSTKVRLALSGDAVACSEDVRLAVVSALTGEIRWSVGAETSFGPRALKFSPDGSLLASATSHDPSEFRCAATGRLLFTLGGPRHPKVRGDYFHGALAFSPDGRTVASGGHDGMATLWEVPSGTRRTNLISPGISTYSMDPVTAVADRRPATHDPWVRALAFSPDGRLLATGGCDHRIQLWDPGTGTLLGSLGQPRNGVKSLAVSADGSVIASRQDDGSIRVFEGPQGRLVASRAAEPGGRLSIALDPLAPRLFTGRKDGLLQAWKVPTLEPLGSLGGPEDSASNLSVSGDGHWLAWGGSRRNSGRRIGHVGFWNLAAGVPGASIEAWGETADGEHAAWGESDWGFLALSPEGKLLAARAGRGAGLWEVETGDFLGEFEGFDEAREWKITCLTFSPDGRSLAAGTVFFSVLLWDVPTRRLRLRIATKEDSICCLAFSPDGKELAIGTDYHPRVWIHDVATGELTGTLEGHLNRVSGVAYAAGGETIVTGGSDGLIWIWDARRRTAIASVIAAPPA